MARVGRDRIHEFDEVAAELGITPNAASIRLHRAIDTFTDQHPVVRRGTRRPRSP